MTNPITMTARKWWSTTSFVQNQN